MRYFSFKAKKAPTRAIPRLFALLPLLFAAFMLFAPAPAAAQSNNGTFDCLGNLDFGCQIISFLFDTTNNTVIYTKGTAQIQDDPGPIENGLRAMMRFFSNAMLIIASLKLLYELIQMVAERAHSGRPKGEEMLWGPLRLVVAIGLLVPLSSGLNSGQYIVMNIAKLGSGLATQTWKAFAAGLTTNQTLPPPTISPYVLRGMVDNTILVYTCETIMNYYADQASWIKWPGTNTGVLADTIREQSEQQAGNIENKKVFSNRVYQGICGTIVYNATPYTPTSAVEDQLYVQITGQIQAEYQNFEPQLAQFGQTLAKLVLPPNAQDPTIGSAAPLVDQNNAINLAANNFMANVTADVQNDNGQQAMQTEATEIQNAANTLGWTSAGGYSNMLARLVSAQNSYRIPTIQQPDESLLAKSYPDALEKYQEAKQILAKAYRTQDPNIATGNPAAGVAGTFANNAYQNMGGPGGVFNVPADILFSVLNWLAQMGGLWDWDSTAKNAFGDIGNSVNPFGEVADYGYKKIRVGLDYIGVAALLATPLFASTVGNVVGAGVAGLGRLAGGALGGPLGAIAGGALGAGLGDLVSNGLQAIAGVAVPVLTFCAFLLLLGGVFMAFLVPMTPFIRFFFCILTWLGSLMEAMIAAPFFALAHLTPKGEGFFGPNTRSGYFMLFMLFVRPTLYIFGLIASILMFYVGAKFLNASFYQAAASVRIFDGATGFVAKMVFSIMYVVLVVGLANSSSKLIEALAERVAEWAGGRGGAHSMTHEDHHGAITMVGTQLGSMATQLPVHIGQQGTKALQQLAGGKP